MKKLLSILLISVSGLVYSQSPAELVQTKLNAIRSMTATFHQVVKAKNRVVSNSSGSMALQRPGHFRWDTKEPLEQLIVADGNRMWIYDVDLEQVTVKKQEKGLGGTAALFLSGYDDTVTRDFEVLQSKRKGMDVFELQSKSSKANFQRIHLIFSKNTLVGLTLFDQLGQITEVKFTHIKENPGINKQLFYFKPPKGVDVVQQ